VSVPSFAESALTVTKLENKHSSTFCKPHLTVRTTGLAAKMSSLWIPGGDQPWGIAIGIVVGGGVTGVSSMRYCSRLSRYHHVTGRPTSPLEGIKRDEHIM
jgi:hypothetical protein